MCPDRRLLDLLKIEHPITQAPIDGASELVVAVSEAGGLGSLPCGMSNVDQIRAQSKLGPLALEAPDFPLAGGALAPLRAAAEREGRGDFSPMWSGQSAALGRSIPAGELTRALVAETRELLCRLGGATTVAPQNAALL